MYELNTELVRERVLGIKTPYETIDGYRRCDASPGAVSRLPAPRLLLYAVQEQELCRHRRYRLLHAGLRRAAELHGRVHLHGRRLHRWPSVWPSSFQRENVTDKVVFGVMGDSTFFHSGMTGAAEIIYNNARMIPVRTR